MPFPFPMTGLGAGDSCLHFNVLPPNMTKVSDSLSLAFRIGLVVVIVMTSLVLVV